MDEQKKQELEQAIKNLEADNEFIEQIIMFLRHYQKRNTDIANIYTEKQQEDGKKEI